jgi:hypothetical protein
MPRRYKSVRQEYFAGFSSGFFGTRHWLPPTDFHQVSEFFSITCLMPSFSSVRFAIQIRTKDQIISIGNHLGVSGN